METHRVRWIRLQYGTGEIMSRIWKCLMISTTVMLAAASSYAGDDLNAALGAEQREADSRVIAARCGTPAFERAFFRQSTTAVKAGLVSKTRPPADVERSITALRRSAFALVASTSDCPVQLAQLSSLMKTRSSLLKQSNTDAGRKR